MALILGAQVLAPGGVGRAYSQQYNITILADFCIETGHCRGGNPEAGLLMSSMGNLYGTTGGGSTAFQMTAGKKHWRLHTIYHFCNNDEICRHGATLTSTPIEDTSGNLYGTALWGGLANSGTVFELSPTGGRKEWRVATLHDFCTKGNCPDGQNPFGGLTYAGAASGQPYDGTSPLYGITEVGGAANSGVVYEVSPSGNGKWSETVLYNFCSQPGCTDGAYPYGALILDTSGNLYGVTLQGGGANNAGTAFELNNTGSQWSETVLHSFCPEEPCSDGKTPSGALFMDEYGNLYGATGVGGSENRGVVYELTPNGGEWGLTVLHDFCALRHCVDGDGPFGPLIMDGSGVLFGTTRNGGAGEGGETFELVPRGLQSRFTVLYSFCSQAGCADGEYPAGGVITDPSGNLYGATENGAVDGSGIVFELTPP